MPSKRIGTHSGSFHCDEALACFMLLLTKEFANSSITRSRDKEVLDQLDVLVDVGGEYNLEKRRFDHHQIGFTATFDEFHKTKLSSAGLIYKHYGKEIIASQIGQDQQDKVDLLYTKIYNSFIEALDAIDNGISMYDTDQPPKYTMRTDLSSRVGLLNPRWNDPNPNPDENFKQAMELVGKEFLQEIDYYSKAWLPARSIVEKAIKSRFEVDPSGEIVLLEQFCPWKEHLQEIEAEWKIQKPILYALFPDQSGSWRVQCVTKSGFTNRLDLPWKGLRDEDLCKESGIPGCIFVHINGFIGGNKTKEGALAMAKKAIAQPH